MTKSGKVKKKRAQNRHTPSADDLTLLEAQVLARAAVRSFEEGTQAVEA